VRPHLHAQNLRHLRITLLFTYSGITNSRIEPIAKSRITVTSLHTAARPANSGGRAPDGNLPARHVNAAGPSHPQ